MLLEFLFPFLSQKRSQVLSFFIGGDDQQGYFEAGWQVQNANIASGTYYQRTQRLLQGELENPTIMLVQSHIYSIIYLYNTSLLNTAHINLGATIRIAHALRLHICPLDGASPEQQELQRRIWWTLYRIDSQLSMTLGRPPLIQLSYVSCGLPGDDREHAQLSGTVLVSNHEDISCLGFHVQCTKLTFLVQGVQTALNRKCSQLLKEDKVKAIYEDPRLLEALAEFLGQEMTAIHNWVQNGPQSLCNARWGAGDPFSTNRDLLNLSAYSSLWLQHQRLLLELHYHHLIISTLRPFTRFPPVSASHDPADRRLKHLLSEPRHGDHQYLKSSAVRDGSPTRLVAYLPIPVGCHLVYHGIYSLQFRLSSDTFCPQIAADSDSYTGSRE